MYDIYDKDKSSHYIIGTFNTCQDYHAACLLSYYLKILLWSIQPAD